MFLDYPVAGTGLGTFEWAFNGYQRQGESLVFRQAHNDYVQVLSETGLVGAALLAWALGVFLLRILVPVLRGVDGEPRWTSIGAAAAVFALIVHSTVDFNLQIPANAAQFAVLLGILAARCARRRSRGAAAGGDVTPEIVLVAGARPNFMKIAPVARGAPRTTRGCAGRSCTPASTTTRAMSEIFFEQLGIPEPDVHLGVGSGSHARRPRRS